MIEWAPAFGISGGPPLLRELTATWEDLQRTRLALAQRGSEDLSEKMRPLEDSAARQVRKALQSHELWPWLSEFPGLGGVHVARLVALIGDPWRFPGQRCTRGHYLPVRAAEFPESDRRAGADGPCPAETLEGPCDGMLLPPRPGTGVRSLWHYCGVHVVNGRAPRKAKGQRADWNVTARTCLLMPGGIAEQIVRQRVPVYRDIYDATKARLTRERGADLRVATDAARGDTLPGGPEVEHQPVIDVALGLRPYQIDAIARKVAAKGFVGDLLIAWKSLSVAAAA